MALSRVPGTQMYSAGEPDASVIDADQAHGRLWGRLWGKTKKRPVRRFVAQLLAERTGLEPATPGVTGRFCPFYPSTTYVFFTL